MLRGTYIGNRGIDQFTTVFRRRLWKKGEPGDGESIRTRQNLERVGMITYRSGERLTLGHVLLAGHNACHFGRKDFAIDRQGKVRRIMFLTANVYLLALAACAQDIPQGVY